MKLIIQGNECRGIFWGIITFFCLFENRILSDAFVYYSDLQWVLRIGLIAAAVAYMVLLNRRISKTTIYLAVLIGVLAVSTLLHEGRILTALARYSAPILVCISIDLCSSKKEVWNALLDTWKWLLLAVVVIDVITELLYPKGMYQTELYTINWFLGYKTQRLVYALPMSMLFIYQSCAKKGQITAGAYLPLIVVLVDCILSQGSGASLAVAFVLVLLFILNKDQSPLQQRVVHKILDFKFVFAFYAACFVVLVLLDQSSIVAVISDFFGKNDDFSGRTMIWYKCMNMFFQSPILGHGYLLSSDYVRITGSLPATNAHNMVITLLITGGVVALGIYIAMYANVIGENKTFRTRQMMMVVYIYAAFLLGITSSALILSGFDFLALKLLEHDKQQCLNEN